MKKKPAKNSRTYETRVIVPAPMPVKCPHCGGTQTVADGGTYDVPRTQRHYQHRRCKTCAFQFVAARPMTPEELARV